MVLKKWLSQVRAPFLLLAILLTGIGGAMAGHDGYFSPLRFALCMIGVVAAHAAVNCFNEISDHATGIDFHTRHTAFSGGTGNLPAGILTPAAVLRAAILLLALAMGIGVYLSVVSGWPVLVFMTVGAFAVVFYTPLLARWGCGEAASGVCLGSFVVMGTYYACARSLSREVALLSVAPGILTALLLLLNEFPDVAADKRGGRRHLVIIFGWKGAAKIYLTALCACFGVILAGAVTGRFPAAVLVSLLTFPLGLKAGGVAFCHGDDFERMARALPVNVALVLGTDLLLIAGYLIAI